MKKKVNTIDFKDETFKEIYKFVRRKRSEKYMLICNILEEIEASYNIDIKEFDFKDKRLSVKVGKNDWVCVNLSEDL